MQFVILASSRGTVMEAVLKKIEEGELTAECIGLVTDKADRGCVERAKAFGVPVHIVPIPQSESREDYDKRLHTVISDLFSATKTSKPAHEKPETLFIACMGWMWMLSPLFVKQWKNRIINVHPALLPKHPGAHAHELVLAAKDQESGMTIHLIDEGMDTGKILLQKSCPVLADDTIATLKSRVQALECEWYPRVLGMIERGEMTL